MKIHNLDMKRSITDVIKREFGTDSFIIAAVINKEVHSYIPLKSIQDFDLVYMIQTLQNRRNHIFGSIIDD